MPSRSRRSRDATTNPSPSPPERAPTSCSTSCTCRNPSPQVVASIHAGVAWLKSAAIYGQEWAGGRGTPGGRHLEAKAGAGPIWARYYSIDTGKPIFGDRDKTIHDDVNELSLERRNGYAWYSAGPQQALEAYAEWSKTHAPRKRERTEPVHLTP